MLPGIVVNQKLGIKAYLDGKIKKVFKTFFVTYYFKIN
jgi:hypothetical protein